MHGSSLYQPVAKLCPTLPTQYFSPTLWRFGREGPVGCHSWFPRSLGHAWLPSWVGLSDSVVKRFAKNYRAGMALPECRDGMSRPKGPEWSHEAETSREPRRVRGECALGLTLLTASWRAQSCASQGLSILIWRLAGRAGFLR